jgi:HPt (histidine-containing phosphotransfer) domain-containing protein
VDFEYLERYAAGDDAVIDEVLALFREQSAIWSRLLAPEHEGWRDAVHTLKGAARGVGANALGEVCQRCETAGPAALPAVHEALDAALSDIAAYAHERALNSLKSSGGASGRAG